MPTARVWILVALVIVSALICSCAPTKAQRDAEAAKLAANRVQVVVDIHVINTWPRFRGLDYKVAQASDTEPPDPDPRASPVRDFTANQLDDLLTMLPKTPDATILCAPRMIVLPGEPATLRVGHDAPDGTPIDGFRFDVTADPMPEGAVGLDLGFEEFGAERNRRSTQQDGLLISRGHSAIILVPGLIGAQYRLVCVTPRVQTGSGGTAKADPFPQLQFQATIGQLSRPLAEAELPGVQTPAHVSWTDPRQRGTTEKHPAIRIIPADLVAQTIVVLRSRDDFEVVSTPSIIALPQHWATVAVESKDNVVGPGAKGPTDGFKLSLRGSTPAVGASKGDDRAIDIRFKVQPHANPFLKPKDLPPEQTLVSADVSVVGSGDAVLVVVPPDPDLPPARARWRILLVAVNTLHSPEDLPVQVKTPPAHENEIPKD